MDRDGELGQRRLPDHDSRRRCGRARERCRRRV